MSYYRLLIGKYWYDQPVSQIKPPTRRNVKQLKLEKLQQLNLRKDNKKTFTEGKNIKKVEVVNMLISSQS